MLPNPSPPASCSTPASSASASPITKARQTSSCSGPAGAPPRFATNFAAAGSSSATAATNSPAAYASPPALALRPAAFSRSSKGYGRRERPNQIRNVCFCPGRRAVRRQRRRPPSPGDRVVRKASIERNTRETRIRGTIRLDGRGAYDISTGIRFLDHMLELFARHGAFDLHLRAAGDLDVDQHHTVEDTGIVLGQLVSTALGDRKGIHRAGYFVMPMDETLAVAAVDLAGRSALVYQDLVRARFVGDLQSELAEDFFAGFVRHAGANLHLRVLYGRSSHHKLEAVFKCFARALRFACSRDPRLRGRLPSTKELLG